MSVPDLKIAVWGMVALALGCAGRSTDNVAGANGASGTVSTGDGGTPPGEQEPSTVDLVICQSLGEEATATSASRNACNLCCAYATDDYGAFYQGHCAVAKKWQATVCSEWSSPGLVDIPGSMINS